MTIFDSEWKDYCYCGAELHVTHPNGIFPPFDR